MPYVLQIIHSKVEPSEKPLRVMDNFPEEIRALNEVYRKSTRPLFKEYNCTFNKIVENDRIVLEYIFETEEDARSFYSKAIADNTNLLNKKINEMIRKLPADQFAKSERTVIFKDPNGVVLSI